MADPGRIRSIAVTRGDVVTALEATLRTDRRIVLRITPPFSGRMRARLHETIGEADTVREGGDEAPIHVDPRELVADVPPYPEVDDTAAAYPDADVETRRERHAAAVAAWREEAGRSIVDVVTLEDVDVDHEVDVAVLG